MSKYFFNGKEGDELRLFFAFHGDYPCKTSIEFTQTGIGVATVVRCEVCETEENVTDYSSW